MTSFDEVKPEQMTMAVQTLVIETETKSEQVRLYKQTDTQIDRQAKLYKRKYNYNETEFCWVKKEFLYPELFFQIGIKVYFTQFKNETQDVSNKV